MTKFFQKIQKTLFFGPFWAFYPDLNKKEFSWKKGLTQFWNISIIYYHAKNKNKINDEPFLRKIPNWRTDGHTDNGDLMGPFVERGSNKKAVVVRKIDILTLLI